MLVGEKERCRGRCIEGERGSVWHSGGEQDGLLEAVFVFVRDAHARVRERERRC